MGGGDAIFGNYVVGDIPVVENFSDGHYIFHVSDEKQKVGYWQKLNDNTFEVKLNDYLSIAEAAKKYQPKGSYLTTQQAAAYLTIQQAQENLLTISAARNIYQEKGNYLTVQQAVQNFQAKGNYVTVDTQSYYLDVNLYEDNASIKLDSKSHTTLSTLILPSATEEKAGLMSANDKQIIRELQEQVKYLTDKVKTLLKNIILPGVFDETNFDESKYQEGEEINIILPGVFDETNFDESKYQEGEEINIILPGIFDETNFDESKYQEGEEINIILPGIFDKTNFDESKYQKRN